MTVRVKICGITRLEDALSAEDAGADAIGFIFVPQTKRHIAVNAALAISRGLGPFVARVGVFRDAGLDVVLETVERAGLSAVQLHSTTQLHSTAPIAESEAFVAQVAQRVPVIRAIAHDQALLPSGALHIDAPEPGSGRTFDWSALDTRLLRGRRWMLAGGLTPDNVASAVRGLQPWGVDVSSGVESAPGIKDATKIRAFVRAARGG